MRRLALFFLTAFLFVCALSAGFSSAEAADPACKRKDPQTGECVLETDDIELLAPFPGMDTNAQGRGVISTSGKGAIEILGEYVSQVFLFGMALIAIFAVIMIMASGYEYMFAGGDSGKVDGAKHRITQALLGLVLVFLSALLLSTLNPNFYKV